MTAKKGFHHIKFIRIMDLFADPGKGNSLEYYLNIVADSRNALETRYGDPNFDIREIIHRDRDYCMTYCGYIKFLKKDLIHSPIASGAKTDREYRKRVKEVASAMICRGLVRFAQSCPGLPTVIEFVVQWTNTRHHSVSPDSSRPTDQTMSASPSIPRLEGQNFRYH